MAFRDVMRMPGCAAIHPLRQDRRRKFNEREHADQDDGDGDGEVGEDQRHPPDLCK
jgi:hypothetical protein